jgi:hypothetical protein
MMKLPMCPHCQKLLVGKIYFLIAIYYCPETAKEQDPEWVEFPEKEPS